MKTTKELAFTSGYSVWNTLCIPLCLAVFSVLASGCKVTTVDDALEIDFSEISGSSPRSGNIAASFKMSPDRYDFGTMTTGMQARSLTVGLENTSRQTLYIPSLSGAANPHFRFLFSDCASGNPIVIPPGTRCSVFVEFSPQAPGSFQYNYTVLFGTDPNDLHFSYSISLAGTAIGPPSYIALSTASVSQSTVASGNTITLTLNTKDKDGNAVTTGGLNVFFSAFGGSGNGFSTGEISNTTDNGDGTYTATFRGVRAGNPANILAYINNHLIETPPPTVTVVPGAISLARSTFTINSSSSTTLDAGNTTPLKLILKDYGSNLLTDAAQAANLSFSVTTGASSLSRGSIGSITPISGQNGSYEATLQGTYAGTSNTVRASLSGVGNFTAAPSFTVRGQIFGRNLGMSSSSSPGTENTVNGAQVSASSQSSQERFNTGNSTGIIYDTTSGSSPILRLSASSNVTSELDASWTPGYSDLVAYYRLNGSLGDITNGTVIPGVIGGDGVASETGINPNARMSYIPGKLKSGIHFNGSSHITLPSNVSLPLDSAVTVMFWNKVDSTPLVSSAAFTIGNLNTPNRAQAHAPFTDNFLYWDYGSNTGNGRITTNYSSYYGKWTHVALVSNGRTGGFKAIYLNGNLITSSTVSDGPGSAVSGGQIGASLIGGSRHPGAMDEFAVFNRVLSTDEIQAIYDRQSPLYTGTYLSKIIDGGTAPSWTGLQWTSTLPFMKELVGNASSETASNYSQISANLMSGNVGLWHLDGALGSIAASSAIPDSSGNNFNGSASNANGTGMSYTATSLGQGILFDGVDDQIPITTTGTLNGTFTVQAWFKPSAFGSLSIVGSRNPSEFGFDMKVMSGPTRTHADIGTGSAWITTAADANYSFSPLKWYQMVYVVTPTSYTIYVNGASIGSGSLSGTPLLFNSTHQLTIGNRGPGGSEYYKGSIDEVGVWNRALSAAEISQLYRRGANRIKFQVRTCAQEDCSDGTFKGPGDSDQTYFTELNNNLDVNSNGNPLATSPNLLFANFTPALSNLSGRYFQYKVLMESDDVGTSCNYGGVASACSPELSSVTINGPASSFPTQGVSLASTVPVTLYSLSSLSQILGPDGCSGTPKFLLSTDDQNWLRWNGALWQSIGAGSYANANTEAEINGNLSSFISDLSLPRPFNLYVRAYLQSDGISPCQLSGIAISGIHSLVATPLDSTSQIAWNTAPVIQDINSGISIAPFKVLLLDSNGNLNVTANTTVSLSAEGSGSLSSTSGLVKNAVSGVASFDGVTYSAVEAFKIIATESSTNSTVSQSFTFPAPQASNGSFSVNRNQSANQTFAATDSNNLTMSYQIVSQPNHGTIQIGPSNTYTYTVIPNAIGTQDQFTFRAFNGSKYSNVATVNITLVNHAPSVTPGAFEVAGGDLASENTNTLSGTDPDGDALRFGIVSNPLQGTLSLNADTGVFTYTPSASAMGYDSFTFKANDGLADSPVETVSIRVIMPAVFGQSSFTGFKQASDGFFTPSHAIRIGAKLAVADSTNNRVLIYNTLPTSFPATPNVVLGQTSISDNPSGTSSTTMESPSFLATDGTKLLVADSGNNRVLIWNTVPTSNSAANVVIGQTSFTGGNSACTATGMNFPTGIVVDAGILYVSDSLNQRVLVYNAIPTANGASPDLLIGQSSTTTCSSAANSTTSVNTPVGLFVQAGKLWLASRGAQRVLAYSLPITANLPAATLVLGRANFTATGIIDPPTLSSMRNPSSITGDGTKLVVADAANNRILIWNTTPTSNGTAADVVLGQSSGTTNTRNLSGTSASSINCDINAVAGTSNATGGCGVFFDGTSLHVADSMNNRVLVWNSIPTSNFAAANTVIGQPNFTMPFAGGFSSGDQALTHPIQLSIVGGKLAVASAFVVNGSRFTQDHRVLFWDSIPTPTQSQTFSSNPTTVLGQPSLNTNLANAFSTNVTAITDSGLNSPTGVSGAGSSVFVADTANHRILIYQAPITTGAAATGVIGQTNFTTGTSGVSAIKLNSPHNVFATSDRLFVADTNNNRVLIYSPLPSPTSINPSASVVLGQSTMTTGTANAGGISASRMNSPRAVFSDGTHLFVAEASNNRVLIWNSIPTVDEQPADLVLGQPGMTSSTINNGGLSASTFSGPCSVWSDGNRVLVTDGNNNRILLWDHFPTQNGQAADHVYGQPNFTSSTRNLGGRAKGLWVPYSGLIYEDWIYVAERNNNRILALPIAQDSSDTLFSGPFTAQNPGPYSITQSQLSAPASGVYSIPATPVTVTLTALDANGNANPKGINTVNFSVSGTGAGTLGSVTNAGNGVYTTTLSPTALGSITVSAQINGLAIAQTATVQVGPIPSQSFSQNLALNSSNTTADPGISYSSGSPQVGHLSISDSSSSQFGAGNLSGVSYDSNSGTLKLNSSSNITGELNESWMPRSSNLMGYWKLNETSGTTFADSSSHGNHGILNGGVTAGVAGKLNQAAQFDGSTSSIRVPNSPSLNSQSFSFSVWVYPTSYSDHYVRVFEKGGYINSTGYSLELNLAGSGRVGFNRWGTTDQNTITHVSSPSALSLSTWHHLAVTTDGSTSALYVDGVLVGTTVGGMRSTSNDLVIGKAALANTNYFTGKLDEMAYWNTSLSTAEIQSIYAHQSARFSGTLLSRVIDAGSAQILGGIAWTSPLPFFKELIGNGNSEIGSVYSEVSANLMNGNIGLWHLNESSWNGSAGEIRDASGNEKHGTSSGASTTTGLFGSAGNFSGSNYAALPTGLISNDFSVSFWMKTNQTGPSGGQWWIGNGLVDSEVNGDTNDWGTSLVGNQVAYGIGGPDVTLFSGIPVNDGSWHHVVGVRNKTSGAFSLTVDGVERANGTGGTASRLPTRITLGEIQTDFSRYQGQLDEIGIWSRVLSLEEIQQLYRRGANRVKFQVRTCANSNCSDGVFKGPDNSSQTYFTELHNNSNVYGTGTVLASAPSLPFLQFTGSANPVIPALTLTPNRYFQYKMVLESDDSATSPEVASVSLGIGYPSNPLSLSTTVPISLSSLGSFTEILGADGCSGTPKYLLSLDNSNWKQWNSGLGWITLSNPVSYSQANTEAEITSNLSSFSAGLSGEVNVYIRAFLHSDGVSPCELVGISVSGVHNVAYSPLNTTSSIAWNPAPAQSGLEAGVPMPSFKVQLLDTNGNLNPSSSSTVTLSLASGTGTLSSPSGLSRPVVNGIATFSNFSYSKAEEIAIRATDSASGQSVTRSFITILPGIVSLAQSQISGPSIADIGRSVPFTLVTRDSNANTNPSGITGVSFEASGLGSFGTVSNSGNGVYTANFIANSNGSASITARINGSALTQAPLTLTIQAVQNFSQTLALNSSTSSGYSAEAGVSYSGQTAFLDQNDTSDSSATHFASGTKTGLAYAANRGLYINSNSNNTGLDSSGTPGYSHLLGYWKMDGTSGSSIAHNTVISSAISGRNGIFSNLNGSGASFVDGKISQGISFDGIDDSFYVENSSHSDFGLNDFAISTWVKTSQNSQTFIVSKRTICSRGNFWNIRNYGVVVFEADDTDNGHDLTTDYGQTPINDSQWHHIVVTRAHIGPNYILKIYVDGKLDYTRSSTTTQNFNSSANIVIANGGACAIPLAGTLDDLAIWNGYALTESDVSTVYSHQSVKYSGTYLSRVMDAGATQSLSGIAWTATLPFLKELIGGGNSETNSVYSDISANLMNGNVGLWHLNESAGTTGPGSIIDSSGNSNAGEPSAVTFGASGRFGTGGSFDGSSSMISLGNSSSLQIDTGTASAWIKTSNPGSSFRSILTKEHSYSLFTYDQRLGLYDWSGGGLRDTGISVADGQWHHVAVTFQSGISNGTILYLDGLPVMTTSMTVVHQNSNLQIATNAGGQNFAGLIDEAAVWNRTLSDTEIAQLYRRGANRVKLQVRTCANSDCSDGVFKGPDNSSQTYFTELNNNSNVYSLGDVLSSAPNLPFSQFIGLSSPSIPALTIAQNRYFQYRAILESDQASTSPELKSVTPGWPETYKTNNPSITSNSAITLVSLASITSTLGSNGCTGTPRYLLSLDHSNWIRWDGQAWVYALPSYGLANTETEINFNLSSLLSAFPAQAVAGTYSLSIKAFLHSDGLSPCELAGVTVTGTRH